jgi:hypothetical protein
MRAHFFCRAPAQTTA